MGGGVPHELPLRQQQLSPELCVIHPENRKATMPQIRNLQKNPLEIAGIQFLPKVVIRSRTRPTQKSSLPRL